MAKVGAHWRGFVSAIGIACLAGGVAMWSLGWLDKDIQTIGSDLMSGIRSYLKVDEMAGMSAPERANIYYTESDSLGFSLPSLGGLGGDGSDNYARLMQNHADRGAIVGHVSVLDGDTLMLNDKPVRLWGIDAPELRQPCSKDGRRWSCGSDARKALEAFIGNKTVACYEKRRDARGRMIGKCFSGTFDLSGWQTRNGWAMAVRSISREYSASESSAKFQRRGIWRDSGIEAPWEWRQRQ